MTKGREKITFGSPHSDAWCRQKLKQKIREAEFVGNGKVKVDVDDVVTYFDGEGNIVDQMVKNEGRTWKLPPTSSAAQHKVTYTKKSIAHPGKMQTTWAQRMIQEYTKPGDLILDPMAGIGTTGVEASRLGRNAILIELEPKWINEAKKNYNLLKKDEQKIGDVHIIKGDAKNIRLNRQVDAIIFSPPYSHTGMGAPDFPRGWKGGPRQGRNPRELLPKEPVWESYGGKENIGMKTGKRYWEDMEKVYEQCHKALKPDGVMVVNTKDRVKGGKVVRLGQQTAELVEKKGFKLIEKRKIPARPSVFREIQERKNPNMPHIRYEDALVFRKT